ncbi:MAG: DUF4249 domain-containing protein, partial [Crocinitomicaceae bacterium]|nr:DUF4249 domain-containing protein [Crocinitomicaceae bacterium]
MKYEVDRNTINKGLTMSKKLLYILVIGILISSCTKEVVIDIPGYEETLVVDGRIETGQPPVIFLSTSKEVYSPTDIETFLNGYISGATVSVSNGTSTVVLDEICSSSLTPAMAEVVSAMLGIPVSQLTNYNICAYTTLDTTVWGEVGKTYTLSITHDGKNYTGETTIVDPTPLVTSYWQPESGTPNHGYSWCTLADPPNQFDGYLWEVNIIGHANGDTTDTGFEPTYSPVFDDAFFDGLEFDFWYENPFAYGGGVAEELRGLYETGDTVLIKLSKMDRTIFEFYEKKYVQLQTAGNPFATPTNIPNNLNNGALGIW